MLGQTHERYRTVHSNAECQLEQLILNHHWKIIHPEQNNVRGMAHVISKVTWSVVC